jgi:hypothetical protein
VFVGETQIFIRLYVYIIYMCRKATVTCFGNITIQPEDYTCYISGKRKLLVSQLEILFSSILSKNIIILYSQFLNKCTIRFLLSLLHASINLYDWFSSLSREISVHHPTVVNFSVRGLNMVSHKYVFDADIIQQSSLCWNNKSSFKKNMASLEDDKLKIALLKGAST